MKKPRMFTLLLAAACLVATPALTACGDDDDEKKEQGGQPGGEGGTGQDPDDDEDPVPGTPQPDMTNEEQKERLEAIGQNFLAEIKAVDVQAARDVAEYVSDQLDSDAWDYSEVNDWADACMESITETLGERTEREETNDGYYNYIHNYFITDYKEVWTAAAFTGHFEETNGRWRKTNANDLQFTFKDRDGKTCVAKVTRSGRETLIHAGSTSDEWWNYSPWDGETWTYTYNIEVENKEIYIRVPERIEVTLTQNGTELVKATVNTTASVAADGELDLSRDKYSVKAEVKVGAYTWNVTRAEYNTTNARLAAEMKHNGNTILTMTAQADGKLTNEEAEEVKNVVFNIDVLGQLQVKGTCSDGKKYVDYLDRADEADENQAEFTRWVNNANALLDMGVYYDKSSTKQAWMRLEVDENSYSWGDYAETYYEYIPVICFIDETSYAFGDYFGEDAFKDLIDTFNDLLEDFE